MLLQLLQLDEAQNSHIDKIWKEEGDLTPKLKSRVDQAWKDYEGYVDEIVGNASKEDIYDFLHNGEDASVNSPLPPSKSFHQAVYNSDTFKKLKEDPSHNDAIYDMAMERQKEKIDGRGELGEIENYLRDHPMSDAKINEHLKYHSEKKHNEFLEPYKLLKNPNIKESHILKHIENDGYIGDSFRSMSKEIQEKVLSDDRYKEKINKEISPSYVSEFLKDQEDISPKVARNIFNNYDQSHNINGWEKLFDKLDPNEQNNFINDKLGITGGEYGQTIESMGLDPNNPQHVEEFNREHNWENYASGDGYDSRWAHELAKTPYLNEDHIEHIKRHGNTQQRMYLFENHRIDPKHGAEIYKKFANDEGEHGYDKEFYNEYMRDNKDDIISMEDVSSDFFDEFQNEIDEHAREIAEENYSVDNYLTEFNDWKDEITPQDTNDPDTHDDFIEANVIDNHDWEGENPDSKQNEGDPVFDGLNKIYEDLDVEHHDVLEAADLETRGYDIEALGLEPDEDGDIEGRQILERLDEFGGPLNINFASHDKFDISDHPEYQERYQEELNEWKDTLDFEDLDDSSRMRVQEDYFNSDGLMNAEMNATDEAKEKVFEANKDSAFKDAHLDDRFIPQHLHGHIPNMEEIKNERQKRLGDGIHGEFLDQHIPNRDREHTYGADQHYYEMVKDHADAAGGTIDIGKMHKAYPNLKDKWKEVFGDKTKMSTEDVNQKLEQIPKNKYNITYGKWGGSKMQNLNSRDEVVVRLDHSSDSLKQITDHEDPELYDTFKKIQETSQRSGHPTNRNTIGWARVDKTDPKHWTIVESQSDFGKSVRNYLKREGHEDKAQRVQTIEDIHKDWRPAIHNFIIGQAKKHGVEKISTMSPEAKANQTGARSIHSTYKEGYEKLPKKMGFKKDHPANLPLTGSGRMAFENEKNPEKLHPAYTLDLTQKDIKKRLKYVTDLIKKELEMENKYKWLKKYEILTKSEHKTGDRIVHEKHGVGTVGVNHGDGNLTVRFDSDTDHSLENKGKKVHIDEIKKSEDNLKKMANKLPESTAETIGSGYNESHFNPVYVNHKGSYKTKDDTYHHILEHKDGSQIHHTSTSKDPYDRDSSISKITGRMSGDGFEVMTSKVKKEHAGKGMGRQNYLNTLAHHGKMLSDTDLTDKSHKAWESLSDLSQGHAKVKLGAEDTDERHVAEGDKNKLQKLLFSKRIAPSKKLAASEKNKNNLKKAQDKNKGLKDVAHEQKMWEESGREGPYEHVKDDKDISDKQEKKKISNTLSDLKEDKQTTKNIFQRVYSIPSEKQMSRSKKAKITGQVPSSVNIYGSHYPAVRLLNEDTLLLHTSNYGNDSKTKQLVGKIKEDLPNHFPDFKVIEVNHPDYRHSAKVMRSRNHDNIHNFLSEASEKHPDEDYRKHAFDSITHLKNIKKAEYGKPIHAKRTENEGWDYQKNLDSRLGKINNYLTSIGLSADLGEGNKRDLGQKSPTSVAINTKGDPEDQQLLHEAGHAMSTPEGVTLPEYQDSMGTPGFKGKIHQTKFRDELREAHDGGMPENTAQQMEAGIARRSGVEPFRSPQRGVRPDTEVERSRQYAKKQLKMFDEGIYRFDPFTGENELQSGIHAYINAKKMGEKDLAQKIRGKLVDSIRAKKKMQMEEDDLAASESYSNDINKGDVKNAVKGGLAALTIAHGAHYMGQEPNNGQRVQVGEPQHREPASTPQVESGEAKGNILRAISESKEDAPSPKYGEQKYGEYSLSPMVIRETIKEHPDLSEQYGHVTKFKGRMLREAMDSAEGLGETIASKHYDKLSRHFGHDPEKISYAWHNGISQTKKAGNIGVDVGNHPYVKSVKQKLNK